MRFLKFPATHLKASFYQLAVFLTLLRIAWKSTVQLDRVAVIMKRKLKWIGCFLAVLLLGLGTALILWRHDRVTKESCEILGINGGAG